MSIPIIFISLFLWGLVHSLLASNSLKNRLTSLLGRSRMRAYRLFYNFFSVISFLPVLYLVASLPDADLYSVPVPISYLLMLVQAAALVLLIIGVLQTDTLNFIGLGQFLTGDKPSEFVTGGLYRFVRHPLYTAGLLFLWSSPDMTVNSFILVVGATCYILVGAYFEERKLTREFGEKYLEYKSRTPMLIPGMKC